MKQVLMIAAFAVAVGTPALASKPMHYNGEKLAVNAKYTIVQARAIALRAHPGKIVDQELENEGGGSGLRYSFDIKTAGNAKTFEVGVDAKTGKVLENKAEGPHPD